MLSDIRLLVWLRARHAWTQLVFWGYATGTDLNSSDIPDRIYHVYLFLLLSGWTYLVSIMAVAQAGEAFARLPYAGIAALLRLSTIAPLVVFAVLCTRHLRSSPLKLTSPDIAYVGASSISTTSLIGVGAALECVRAGLIGCALGYLLGVGMAAAGTGAVPGGTAVITMLIAAAVVLGAWLIGTVRLASGYVVRRLAWLAVWPAAALIALLQMGGSHVPVWPSSAVTAALTGGDITVEAVVLGAVVVLGALALAWASRRADVMVAIDESALYAELQPVRLLRLTDPSAYRDIARRKRLARRRPRFKLPIGEGPLAPVSRAALSYLRQPGRLLSVLPWGALVVPAGVALVLWRVSPMFYVPWIALTLSRASNELVRIFRDDIERPSLRQSLPFDTLSLLLLDSALATAVAAVASLSVLMIVWRPGTSLAAGPVLAVLLNLVVVLCRGIGMLEHPFGGRAASFELSMLAASGLIATCALFGGAWFAVGGAAVAVFTAGAAVRAGRE